MAEQVDHKTTDPTLLMMMWMRKEYPKLPEEVIMRTIPDLSKEVDTTKLPWNRRKRRSLEKAERVILHLFSGKDEKSWQTLEGARTQVLCIDVLLHGGSDLNNDNVFRYLLDLAVRGKICGVIDVHVVLQALAGIDNQVRDRYDQRLNLMGWQR